MPRILALDPHVVNKIAAGEVIERPAGVVKELLENSIDALATRISVDIQQGGAELIRIVDDGEGIHPDDILLAVTSHATSKIRDEEDLFHVHSLGFRGEALASIASVSHFRLRSRIEENTEGREIEIRGGEILRDEPCGCPVGTLIEVKQLFGNTPVRRKFMKTQGTEFGHISEQFTRIALAHPRLHLTLRHNDKTTFELPATTSLLDRLTLFYGASFGEKMIWVESEYEGVKLWGYVGHPSLTKGTRKGQYFFLNGRWIQDRALQHALSEAYRGLVMVGRHPVSFLFWEMPSEKVDVNVHPTKSEVRFLDSQQLYRQLLNTLRTTFLSHNLDSKLNLKGGPSETSTPKSELEPSAQQKELIDWAKEELSNFKPTERIGTSFPATSSSSEFHQNEHAHSPAVGHSALNATAEFTANPEQISSQECTDSIEHTDQSNQPVIPEGNETEASSGTPASTSSSSSALQEPEASTGFPSADPIPQGAVHRVLQVNDCYLVLETEEGLTVIDQHALHERILFEQFRHRILSGSLESQRMLIPETVDLSPKEMSLVKENLELFSELGFGVEEFGKNTILINAYPRLLQKANLIQLIHEIVDELDQPGGSFSKRDLLESVLQMMSCKAAIKSGQRLNQAEIDSLLALRHLVQDAHHCPHGRPTALVLSREELDRQFGRLGS